MVAETLPNLPGYTARVPLEAGDRRHYKKTTLTYLRGYAVDEAPVHADVEPPPPVTEKITEQSPPPLLQSSPDPRTADFHYDSSKGPKWVQNDRKVLRWYGYFKEAIPESPVENHRVRKLVVCHYLADGTTEALEPKVTNSGIWQGSFIKRHIIKKPCGLSYGAKDIKVGENVELYGKVIHIVDADAFTRTYLAELGEPLKDGEPLPLDPVDTRTLAASLEKERKHQATAAPSNGILQIGRLQTYLLNSKKVLRFYCVWDDRQQLYGDRRPFRLHFYLEDGTIEILEVHENNSGRDHFPVFLRRSALPKDPMAYKTGTDNDRKLCFGLDDLRIGTFIQVYSRSFFIHDCDDFTRQWYKENMGFSDEAVEPVDVREEVPLRAGRTLPPYNGYGSLEDSAENCKHLIPKQPKKDFYKLINKGKIVLRFGSKFHGTADHPISEDHSERHFVISYFLADDSISIFEHPTDGFPGGKFLERGRVPRDSRKPGNYLTDKDLFVGADIQIYKHAFKIESADEYTLQYMENNRHEYRMADWEAAVHEAKNSLRGADALRAALVETGASISGKLVLDQLINACSIADFPLTMHQVISIHRHLSKGQSSGPLSAEAVLQVFGFNE